MGVIVSEWQAFWRELVVRWLVGSERLYISGAAVRAMFQLGASGGRSGERPYISGGPCWSDGRLITSAEHGLGQASG